MRGYKFLLDRDVQKAKKLLPVCRISIRRDYIRKGGPQPPVEELLASAVDHVQSGGDVADARAGIAADNAIGHGCSDTDGKRAVARPSAQSIFGILLIND